MTYWKSAILAGLLLVLGCSDPSHAANCSSYPYTLTNGQTADANQVMADFNNILSCGNNNLLGKANNLSDVTSPATSFFNIGGRDAGKEGLASALAGAVTDDGAGNLYAAPAVLHSQKFTTSGTFTVPASALATTVFKFTVIGSGGGGAGGGGAGGTGGGGGGASGGAIVAEFTGFTASGSVNIVVGTAGAGGATGTAGGTGNVSSVTYAAAGIVTANGGVGGTRFGACTGSAVPGSASASSGGGTALVAFWGGGAQPGSCVTDLFSGAGGSNYIGSGGGLVATATAGNAGVLGGGGGGGGGSGAPGIGGAGGAGLVLVEWVL